MDTTLIGIAVVESAGSFLVGRRMEGQVLAGKAEFPGGKCEPGEASDDCAVRECREETGLTVIPDRLLDRTVFEYDHGCVELHFWLCQLVDTDADPDGEFQWIPAAELRDLPFPEGNARVLQTLTG